MGIRMGDFNKVALFRGLFPTCGQVTLRLTRLFIFEYIGLSVSLSEEKVVQLGEKLSTTDLEPLSQAMLQVGSFNWFEQIFGYFLNSNAKKMATTIRQRV